MVMSETALLQKADEKLKVKNKRYKTPIFLDLTTKHQAHLRLKNCPTHVCLVTKGSLYLRNNVLVFNFLDLHILAR